MAEEFINYANRVRSYEVSIWTLQDRFLSVLKWAAMECKGQIQDPEVILRDDGTQEFTFSIPKYYYQGLDRLDNPMWLHLEGQPLEANMHKLKVIFNKGEGDEKVFEFLVTSVVHDHQQDNVVIQVKTEGLAFHELGKVGYKISLSETNYTNALDKWEAAGLEEEQPLNNIQFWNDLIFKNSKGEWRTNWTYEIHMDWSAFSPLDNLEQKDSSVLYEDEYISSWQVGVDGKMIPREVQATREKCRIIETSESNIYNITQTIAEDFGVFCRYEYEYDDSYQIIGRKVIYYNNFIQDSYGHIDLTYPYVATTVTRTVDSSNITSKMFVTGVDYDDDTVTIMDVDANKSKEDYILNFEYLHDIQAITDEQYEQIELYEAKMFTLNERLIKIQERIRIVQNQLTDIEAKATTYANQVNEDMARINEANESISTLLTDAAGVPLTGQVFTVMYSKECGYYITITRSGIQPDTVELYRTMKGGDYVDKVTKFVKVTDEFGDLTRIEHISWSGIGANYTGILYMSATWCPQLVYEKVAEVYNERLKIDEQQRDYYQKLLATYNWYLCGSRLGYTKLGNCLLGELQYPLCVIWDDTEGELDIPKVYWSNIVGACRIINNLDEFEGIEKDYFSEIDNKNSSPDLLYYQDEYIKLKEDEISRFERMMGPALREGYWNPEKYHDYGDLFNDAFTIDINSNNIVQPETSHLQVLWDGDKYFENEEPAIYLGGVNGVMKQHLIIDISTILDDIKGHLDDICFVYSLPSVVAAMEEIKELQKTEKDSNKLADYEEELETLSQNMYTYYRLGGGCELGWVIKEVRNSHDEILPKEEWPRIPVLIVTSAQSLGDDTLNYIVSNRYVTQEIDIDDVQLVDVEKEATLEGAASFVGLLNYYEDEAGNKQVDLGNWTRLLTVGKNINVILGATYNDENKIVFNNICESVVNENGAVLPPTPQQYKFIRQYPRLYFDTLKLKDEEVKILTGAHQLENNKDYYIVEDDRSQGLIVSGVGYYATIKPEIFFGSEHPTYQKFKIVYTLSNVDVSIYLDALKVSEENARPKVSYDIQLSVLNPEFIHAAYNRLNQIVYINDNDLKLEEASGYISTVTMKLDKPWEDTVEIKNYETKFEDLFTTIVAQTEAMKSNQYGINTAISAFTATGLITEDVIANSIRQADLNYAFDSGKLTIDQNEGIWGTSEKGVVAFRGGGIFTATQKDSSGNWLWNTGILPSGINANLITSGQLDTNKIRVFAGDDLRFQWNEEGLFAYKPFRYTNELTLTGDLTGIDLNKSTILDQKQYVRFNKDGLFLISEKGAYIPLTKDGSVYEILNHSVERVEISWNGLILRNWAGDPVFSADPDTGNLTLLGRVEASTGKVGGWEIQGNMLKGDYINLISGTTDESLSGIVLTQGQDLQQTELDSAEGTMYFKSTYTENGQQKTAYTKDPIIGTTTVKKNQIYEKITVTTNVFPKYIKTEEVATSGETVSNSIGDNTIILSNPTQEFTVKQYIMQDAALTQYVEVGGTRIEYDGDSSTNAGWYTSISNMSNLIDTVTKTTFKALEGTDNVQITPTIEQKITFRVQAHSGDVTILKGKLGSFTVNDANGTFTGGILANSTLSSDNKIKINDSTSIPINQLFYDCTTDSNAGTVIFKRVNGSTVNFNMAATSFYKKAIDAASKITLTVKVKGETQVVLTATSG